MSEGLGSVRLVNHRRQHHQARNAQLLHVSGVTTGGGGAALRHSPEDGHTATTALHPPFPHPSLFVRLKRRVFAKRPEHDQTGDPRSHQHFQVPRGRVQVECLVAPELSGRRGENAFPIWFHPYPLPEPRRFINSSISSASIGMLSIRST